MCDDGSFCCGKKNTTCCADQSGFYLNENGTEIVQGPSGQEPSTHSSSTLVPTSLQTHLVVPSPTTKVSSTEYPTATNTELPSKEGLTDEAKIALGVGLPSIAIAFIALWHQCWKHRVDGKIYRPYMSPLSKNTSTASLPLTSTALSSPTISTTTLPIASP